ncbi:MAG: Bro-N domain-containing protein [Bacteroidaceae bacterium]|nr:Bro-N domain-containing protein [Bacteroidaceae bacterium]
MKKRVINKGQTLVCGKDVCDALQHTNSRRAIAKLVDEGDVTKRYTITSSGEQQMTFINESGLYSLILSSKLLNKNTLQEKLWKDM